MPSVAYDADSIETLDPCEHVRSRPGMYIGATGTGEHHEDGIYILLKEVMDNAVDEFMMGQGRRIQVTLTDEGMVTVRDFGRGIPLDKLKDCVLRINTGRNFRKKGTGDHAVFSSSIGMNGVGLKAVTFLSAEFEATSWRDGEYCTVLCREGRLVSERRGKEAEPNGTRIRFQPSSEIFPGFRFEKKFVQRRMQHYAWLNTGLSIECNGEKYYSRRGLLDLLEDKLESEALYEIIHYRAATLEFAFCHTNSGTENYYSFCNTQYTNDGGTHLAAFKEGVVKGINELAPKDKQFDADDIRAGILGAVAVRVAEPVFESQTKNKLTSQEIRGPVVAEVKAAVVDYLYKHPETKEKIFEKISKNESVRKQIQSIRKNAKELASKSQLKIEKLRECKYHFNETDSHRKPEEKQMCQDSMIFLTEGDSAASIVISARDANTQAVFALRGVPLNIYGCTKEFIYSKGNEELYGVTRALGTEDSLENLRYGKVVIATDADPDGYHIRNLLITFFLKFFPQLVTSEHLFILETPLFRIRNKSKNLYAFSEAERDAAAKQLGNGKDVEITRFKGLGEIDPQEFKQFIHRDKIRLLPVTVEQPRNLDAMLRFLMGGNTPQRKQYIMENLMETTD